jgi:hypothetical protein
LFIARKTKRATHNGHSRIVAKNDYIEKTADNRAKNEREKIKEIFHILYCSAGRMMEQRITADGDLRFMIKDLRIRTTVNKNHANGVVL